MSNLMPDHQTITRYPIGIAVIILSQQRVLIGKRRNNPMPESWQLPGGWLLQGQDATQAATRIIEAFDGIEYDRIKPVSFTENIFEDGSTSLSLYYQLNCLNADRMDMSTNPDCDHWFWCDWKGIPEPRFSPLQRLIDQGYQP